MATSPTRRGALVLAASALFAPAAFPSIVRAQTPPKKLNYGLTSKTSNDWVNFLSEKLGFFTAHGVQPDFIVVGSASGNGQQMAAGSLDMGGIASPNLIEAVIGGAPLTVVVARTRVSPYVIVAKKGYRALKELAGKMVIVDSPSGITRLMVDGVLEANHMKGSDVTYTYAGGTPERFAALMSGAVDAAMLLPPFSFRATAQGYPVLAEIPKYFPTLPVDQTAANVNFAKAHPDVLGGYLRGYLQGLHWIYDPANEAQATAILTEATNTSPEDAKKTYDVYVRGKVFSPDGVTSIPGMTKMLEMLAKLGQIKPPIPPATSFVSNQYIQEAAAQLKKGG